MLLFRKSSLWRPYKLRHVTKRDMFVFIKLQILNYKVSVSSMPHSIQCTEVHFASFLSGGFITAIVVNPPERKLAKRTSVQWYNFLFDNIFSCFRMSFSYFRTSFPVLECHFPVLQWPILIKNTLKNVEKMLIYKR